MKHRINRNNFSRTGAHRKAMLRNLVISLFEHRRVKTTPQKAKAARRIAEKLITLAKKAHAVADTAPEQALHYRRRAISRLASKRAVKQLFALYGPMYPERNGGYTRILHLPGSIRLSAREIGTRSTSGYRRAYGWRLGDGADQVYLELVEAEVQPKERRRGGPARRRTARSDADAAAPAEKAADTAEGQAPADEASTADESSDTAPANEVPAETQETTPAGDETQPAENNADNANDASDAKDAPEKERSA